MSMYILVGTVVIRLAWMQLQSLRVRSWRGLVLYPSYAVWYTAVWMSSKPFLVPCVHVQGTDSELCIASFGHTCYVQKKAGRVFFYERDGCKTDGCTRED